MTRCDVQMFHTSRKMSCIGLGIAAPLTPGRLRKERQGFCPPLAADRMKVRDETQPCDPHCLTKSLDQSKVVGVVKTGKTGKTSKDGCHTDDMGTVIGYLGVSTWHSSVNVEFHGSEVDEYGETIVFTCFLAECRMGQRSGQHAHRTGLIRLYVLMKGVIQAAESEWECSSTATVTYNTTGIEQSS